VPRQHGSGGKVRLHGMTKSGDHYLRTMMLHGARAAIRWSRERDTPLARWINPMIEWAGWDRHNAGAQCRNFTYPNPARFRIFLRCNADYAGRSLITGI